MQQEMKRICAAFSRAALFLALMGATLWRENVVGREEPPTQDDRSASPRGPHSLR